MFANIPGLLTVVFIGFFSSSRQILGYQATRDRPYPLLPAFLPVLSDPSIIIQTVPELSDFRLNAILSEPMFNPVILQWEHFSPSNLTLFLP